MTTGTEAPASPIKLRADRIRRRAYTVLFLNLGTYPLSSLILGKWLPKVSKGHDYFDAQTVLLFSMFIAFMSVAHIGRAYELEFQERAENNPDLTRTGALMQRAVRFIGWTIACACSAFVILLSFILFKWVFAI